MKAQNDLAIEISGLQKSYGQNKAVDGISFSISKGEIFGMLGPNGAGKSTTVEILVGLLQKNGGEVRVLGLDPEKEPNQVKTRIGVQLQTAFLFPRLKVLEVMKLFASFYPRHLDIEQIIERVGLGEKRNAKVRELSGGQLKRLTVAIAMLNDGDIVFLDEPTSGLDPQSRRFLWDAVKELKDKGKTVFLTTHYMDEAQKLCDRVAIIDKGKVIAIGSPEKLIEDNFKESALEFSQTELADEMLFEGLEGISKVKLTEDSIIAYTMDIPQAISSLMTLAGKKGVRIDDLKVRQATLEDVFIKLTGRWIRE